MWLWPCWKRLHKLILISKFRGLKFTCHFFFYFYVWVILHLIYSIHILYIGKAKELEKERQVFLFLQFFVSVFWASSQRVQIQFWRMAYSWKEFVFFCLFFCWKIFIIIFILLFISFLKKKSLNDYIFLFCLFFHLPPKKSNSDCHLFCVSLMQNKWETRVARQTMCCCCGRCPIW